MQRVLELTVDFAGHPDIRTGPLALALLGVARLVPIERAPEEGLWTFQPQDFDA